jgi:hypothetical protein
VIAGSYTDGTGSSAGFVTKMNSTVIALAKKSKRPDTYCCLQLSEDNNGNVFVTGKSDAGAGNASDFWAAKLSTKGDILLNQVYELTGYNTYENTNIKYYTKRFCYSGFLQVLILLL